MSIDVSTVGHYQLVTVTHTLTLGSDIDELLGVVHGCLSREQNRVALAFTKNSYLSSRAIGVLARCMQAVRAKGETLVLIAPSNHLLQVLKDLRLGGFLAVANSVDDLTAAQPQQEQS